MTVDRWRRLLPGLWAGWLLCVAGLATPAPFALLAQADAGRVVSRMAPYCGTGAREIVRLPWTTAHPIADPLRDDRVEITDVVKFDWFY